MAIKYAKKRSKPRSVFYTIVTAVLLCAVFFTMVSYLYISAEEEAYENLHIQTKQIKDDIILQVTSDRENLYTMANFASKLYSDGESYDLMFESFKPIGLIEGIGILNSDNTFTTKSGTVSLDGMISFEEEKAKGAYISGRVQDIIRNDYELIRTTVPINVNGDTVGILYGVIDLGKITQKYSGMAQELDAQLFVYEKVTGDLVIDTVHDKLGNISFLKDRKYAKNYSYEEMISTDKGFTSFVSAYRDENMHLHYSTIDDIGWMIALARYDSQVFATTNILLSVLLLVFVCMLLIIGAYIMLLLTSEKNRNNVNECASDVRKQLIETSDERNNILESLITVCKFAKSRSVIFFDTNQDDYHCILEGYTGQVLQDDNKKILKTELFRYASELYRTKQLSVVVMEIKTDKHLKGANGEFYDFLKKNEIQNVLFSAVINKANHITILGVINSKHNTMVKLLLEKVVACFAIALYNKNHLAKTEYTAMTDGLTGVLNRAAYKESVAKIDKQNPLDFACVYFDVNELHICNNNYGHAAGDEMLIYIANTLKEVFFGHNIYRVGGDEFLVFCENTSQDVVKRNIENFAKQLEPKKYHVSIGMSYRSQNTNTEEMVREAEKRMYDEKAKYYQKKEEQSISTSQNKDIVQINTGIPEIDTMISVLKENYFGIYRVSLNTDKARGILMPAYLNYNEEEDGFSKLLTKYVAATVDPDYHRVVTNFINYDYLKSQLSYGKTLGISYKKLNNEMIKLSIHKLKDSKTQDFDTLWIFTKA